MTYPEFLDRKSQLGTTSGFDPIWMPDFLFDFQRALVEWAIVKGRAAILADCGLGKTPMALVWAENIIRKECRPVLIITPLAVSAQTIREGKKFGIEVTRSADGKITGNCGIWVTNYERLHHFNPDDFGAVVCDESSVIKSFEGERQKIVTEFLRNMPYRLLCTATAAPNDYIELLTSSEALGELGRMDALAMFFRNDENSLHPIWWGARWRFRQHAEQAFWRWVCSWSRACRKPSDLGFEDGRFVLPPLIENETVVKRDSPLDGFLFSLPAITLKEQRAERRETIRERCSAVAEKVYARKGQSLMWCHLNPEGDLLERMIADSAQVSGKDPDEKKEELFMAFADGQLKRLVTKQKIGGFGLNLQGCDHITAFPSHSWEQYYQGVRRCWRFGQKNPVTVDIITTEGELGVLKNLQRKAAAADRMFDVIVAEMHNALKIRRTSPGTVKEMLPAWL